MNYKSKAEIRVDILTKRLKQLPMMKTQRDKRIMETIDSTPEFLNAKNVLFYMPIHGEVDLTSLFDKYKEQKKFVLPRVIKTANELTLYVINNLTDLEESSFRIPEPKTNLESVTPEQLDFIILPGVAFSPDGHRIGYGQGFFDKMLKNTSCLKVGVAYEFQIVENIPGEDHDVPMDRIVTESRTIIIPKT